MHYSTMNTPEFKRHSAAASRYYSYLQTPGGLLEIWATDKGIYQTLFVTNKRSHQDAQERDMRAMPLLLVGTDFQIKVWKLAFAIPSGTTLSYGELAQRVGSPKAHRAVARALATNKIAYFIPCHRIIGGDGALRGYAWGLEIKQQLVDAEKQGLKK